MNSVALAENALALAYHPIRDELLGLITKATGGGSNGGTGLDIPSGGMDDSVSVDRGTLPSLHEDRLFDPVAAGPCSFSGCGAQIDAGVGDDDFLVVGSCAPIESFYGRDSLGVERPAATDLCP